MIRWSVVERNIGFPFKGKPTLEWALFAETDTFRWNMYTWTTEPSDARVADIIQALTRAMHMGLRMFLDKQGEVTDAFRPGPGDTVEILRVKE
jgi:hypothetical protein